MKSKKYCASCGRKRFVRFFGSDVTKSDGLASYCKDCRATNQRLYHGTHKAQYRVLNNQWHVKNRTKKQVQRNLYRKQLRNEVVQGYGGQCACCGEKHLEFLAIDHVFDDGKLHRRFNSGNGLLLYLKRNGFPKDGFRLLCHNCNQGRYLAGGICPHKLESL